MSVTPPRTKASASPTFCTHWPTAPCAIWRSAMAGDLCVLACGRTRTPVVRENSAIFAMLRSSASRSTISAGVSISGMEAPISAGGGFMSARRQLWKPQRNLRPDGQDQQHQQHRDDERRCADDDIVDLAALAQALHDIKIDADRRRDHRQL